MLLKTFREHARIMARRDRKLQKSSVSEWRESVMSAMTEFVRSLIKTDRLRADTETMVSFGDLCVLCRIVKPA